MDFSQIKLSLANMWFWFQDYHRLFCLITGFLPLNSQYFNSWKCGQQCDEIKVIIIIVKEWHICYLLAFSDNWSSIWTIEKLPNCQTQKLGWVKKYFFFLVLKWNSYIVLQLVHLNSLMKGLFFDCLFWSSLRLGGFFSS